MSPSKPSPERAPAPSEPAGPARASADAADFVQLVREYLAAHTALREVFERHAESEIPFSAIRALVGDDDRAVLWRLKEKCHALFRSHGLETRSVRREALFDLAVGSLFHETMTLRETLYQREVYAPRVASLREASDDDSDALFEDFDRILEKSLARLGDVVFEVRALLDQTRDQLRRLLVERAGDRTVTRCLLSRREQVDATFPEGFAGLLDAMHGDRSTGLIEGARALLESAYFVEAAAALREAEAQLEAPHREIGQLRLYAEGMQAFVDGHYASSIEILGRWVEGDAHRAEPEFARLAGSVLRRLGRLVEDDAEGAAIVADAQRVQVRLDTASA